MGVCAGTDNCTEYSQCTVRAEQYCQHNNLTHNAITRDTEVRGTRSRTEHQTPDNGSYQAVQGEERLRIEGEGRGADQDRAPQQGSLHHREVLRREAAAGAGQDQVPHPGPRDGGGAGEDHQEKTPAPPRTGILPPGELHQPRPRLHADV